MGDIRNEPSMEDILASIKRIIAEDSANPPSAPRGRGGPSAGARSAQPQEAAVPQPPVQPIVEPKDEEEVLELTQSIDPAAPRESEPPVAEQPTAPEAGSTPDPRIVSDSAASASRQALAALSAMIVKPEGNGDNTLDGLVREMLRPMLKEWLDSRLPELVQELVEKEIARITGRAF
jgi:cell pole-organizing protein PopZ